MYPDGFGIMFKEIYFINRKIFYINYRLCCLISLKKLGPLTYTSNDGQTTLYGVVSGGGCREDTCMTSTVNGRVSEPGILRWIKANIEN